MNSNAEGLRQALRWLSDTGRHDTAAIDEACLRFDLTPADAAFLLAQRPTAESPTAALAGPRGEDR